MYTQLSLSLFLSLFLSLSLSPHVHSHTFTLSPLQHAIPRQLDIPCRRDHVFEDSYKFITNIRDPELLKSRLYVKFKGETGLDYGGLAREWFYLLSHEMFSPYCGLFEYSARWAMAISFVCCARGVHVISSFTQTASTHSLFIFLLRGEPCAQDALYCILIYS